LGRYTNIPGIASGDCALIEDIFTLTVIGVKGFAGEAWGRDKKD
jgi:hypothetical protein